MENANLKTGSIRLSFQSREQVVVVPENEDRFLMTSSAAAQACQSAQASQEWRDQFSEFLSFLNHWCDERADRVGACYVAVGDTGLNVLILVKSEHFDFEFGDELAGLDLELAGRFPLCVSDVIQIPKQTALIEELTSGELESESLIVYGDGAGSS